MTRTALRSALVLVALVLAGGLKLASQPAGAAAGGATAAPHAPRSTSQAQR